MTIIFLLGFLTAGLMVAGLSFGSTKVQAAQVNVPMKCQKEVLVPYQKKYKKLLDAWKVVLAGQTADV